MTAVVVLAMAIACLLALASAQAAFGPLDQQQRITHVGPDGDTGFGAFEPSVAYNSSSDEYLVVWQGLDDTPPPASGELEIFGQRLSDTGTPLGGRFRVSEQGPDGNGNFEVSDPSVAYNPVSNEYLVVWEGDTGSAQEVEIWAQRLSASGAEVGGSDFRVSDMGPEGDVAYAALRPKVVANAATGEYLVVWDGDDNTPPLVFSEDEIFGQRLTAAGAEAGANDFRISEQGANGDPTTDAREASLAYDPLSNEYLVAWQGEIGPNTEEFEIWAQRLSANGAEVGGIDFQVSDMGPDGNALYDAGVSSVAANPTTGDYLVVWEGSDGSPLALGEFEIFGQRLNASGTAVGANDFRISEMGLDGSAAFNGFHPDVTADPRSGEYLVVWDGDEGVDEEYEIWGQRLARAGTEVGGDFRLSTTGPEGNANHDALMPAVATERTPGEHLVVWHGDEINSEFEIYGRRLGVAAPVLTGTDPPGPANNNAPKVKASIASVDAASTIDVFANASCSGTPAVNDAPAGDLIGSGITVTVANNSTTSFSVTSTLDGHVSRCSNAIAYTEQTPPPPPPPPPPIDMTAPVVSGFSVVPAKLRSPKISRFRFRLSERATVRILVERKLPGRRVGKRCVPPTPKLRKRPRCIRFKRVGTLTFRNRPANQNAIVFRGRIGRRVLAAGSYRATITATDAAGNLSKPKRASLVVIRRS